MICGRSWHRNLSRLCLTKQNSGSDSSKINDPKSDGWTGWSTSFLGCRARRNDAEWLFHSKELQRSHVPQKLCNPPRNGFTKRVKVKYRKTLLLIICLS